MGRKRVGKRRLWNGYAQNYKTATSTFYIIYLWVVDVKELLILFYRVYVENSLTCGLIGGFPARLTRWTCERLSCGLSGRFPRGTMRRL